MQATLDHRKPLTDTIESFYFKPEKPFRYTAGQFIELFLPPHNEDERGHKRWFTLSSSPTEGELVSITTKFSTSYSSYFKNTLQALKPGDTLKMSSPMGDFVLPKRLQTPIVFVAGGMGITPMHSMLQYLADTGEQRPIKLLYAVKHEKDIIFQDTFEAAGVHATIVVTEPEAAWGGERGHLTAEQIIGLEAPSKDTLIYLSGPEPMIESLYEDLKKAGLRKDQLVTDYFPGYQAF